MVGNLVGFGNLATLVDEPGYNMYKIQFIKSKNDWEKLRIFWPTLDRLGIRANTVIKAKGGPFNRKYSYYHE